MSGHEHMDHEHMDHAAMGHDMHGMAGMSAADHAAMGHDPAMFRTRFWICLALTVPTLVFSRGLQDILHLTGPRFPGSDWIPAAFGAAIMVIGGWVFLKGAWQELRAKNPGMMTLIALAIVVAFGYSLAVTIGLPGMDFWWELATLVTIMLLGHWIEMRAVMGAQDALGELAKLVPDQVEHVHGDHVMTMPTSMLQVGHVILVRPGGRVAADGEVVDGEGELDQSVLTGESAPVSVGVGSKVVAGSLLSGGSISVRVEKLGGDTALAGIARLVADAQASKSSTQLLADRAAKWLFYIALAAAAITLVVWLLLKPDDLDFVLERVVAVLVIACPHALGLAIPLVAQLATAIGAKHGLLVRQRAALETTRQVDTVLFDKTGTLTEGRMSLSRWVPVAGHDEAELLRLAAAVELKSEHAIGQALVAVAKQRGLKLGRPTAFATLPGRGVQASVDGRVLQVVSARQLNESGLKLPTELVHAARETAGATVVYLREGDEVLGLFAFSDAARPESAQAVQSLQRAGIRVAMLTGDSHAVAQRVADQLGIDEVHAEVLPANKADEVRALQANGAKVAMVGDGVNDSPALATADVGIAIGAGTDVAIESAGIVLAGSDPRGVADAVTLSRATYRKMLQNLAWATGYNAIGIPLAAGVLAGVGFIVPPAAGAVVMSLSTIIVAVNAQLLRFTRFSR